MQFSGLEENATVSVGVAMASEAGRSLTALLATADRALYRAKAEGRNHVHRRHWFWLTKALATLTPDAGKIGRYCGAGSRLEAVGFLFRSAVNVSSQALPAMCSTGVIGCCLTWMPSGRSASFTAVHIAPGAPTVPASPTPFAPSPVVRVGVVIWAMSISGISDAIGTR